MMTSASQKPCALGTLIGGVTDVPVEADIEISGISLDSRQVTSTRRSVQVRPLFFTNRVDGIDKTVQCLLSR